MTSLKMGRTLHFTLNGSTVQKLGTGRLGLGGTDESKVHPELEGKLVNVNCGQKWLNWGTSFAAHSYQWDDEAIKFMTQSAFKRPVQQLFL